MAAGIMACDADPEWREHILRGMTLVALFDGEPGPEALELLDRTARSFQVNASPVRSYRNVMQERLGMVRLDLVRRSFVRDAARDTLRDGGLPMLAATLKVVSGHRDQATLERFQALQDYPNGSFGKAYADFTGAGVSPRLLPCAGRIRHHGCGRRRCGGLPGRFRAPRSL